MVSSEKNLLILDDDPEILLSLERQLQDQPFRVLTCQTAEDAIRLMDEESVQVILCDLNMPHVDGMEFLVQIQRLHPGVIRLVISGDTNFNSILEAVNQGNIYGFIIKPWKKQELVLTILKSFEMQEVSRERDELLFRSHKLNGELIKQNQKLEENFSDLVTEYTSIYPLFDAVCMQDIQLVKQQLGELIANIVGGLDFVLYLKISDAFSSYCHSRTYESKFLEISVEQMSELLSSNSFKNWQSYLELDGKVKGRSFPLMQNEELVGLLVIHTNQGAPVVAREIKNKINRILPLIQSILANSNNEIS